MAQFWDPHLGDVRMAGLKFGTVANPYGSIDQTPIGQTTPAPGSFSTLNGAAGPGASTIAGNVIATPTPITAQTSNVTTADATHIAVILPTGVAGDQRVVYNSGLAAAETLSIYCQSTDTIDGGSAGGHVTLTAAHRAARFYCVAANTWISELFNAVSS